MAKGPLVSIGVIVFLKCSMLLAQPQGAGITIDQATGDYLIRYTIDGKPLEIRFVPATKVKPVVKASLAFDAVTRTTTYSYSVANNRDSIQELKYFMVQSCESTEPRDAVTPTGWRFDRGTRFVNWVMWSYLVPSRGLPPGQSQDGFSFNSKHLPGVVTVYFRGNTSVLSLPGELPAEVEKQLKPIYGFENDSVRRFSIGPSVRVSETQPCDLQATLTEIRSHIVDAVPQELLRDKGLRDSLYQTFAAALAALQAKQGSTARLHLSAAGRALAQRQPGSMSPELAAALDVQLKYFLTSPCLP